MAEALNPMKHHSLKSTNLKSTGYDPATKTLEVTFHNGGTYRYQHVSQQLYDGLLSAASHGRYFEQHIKTKKHPFEKL